MPQWSWGRSTVQGLGLILACASFAPSAVLAAPGGPEEVEVLFHNGRSFRIPFEITQADRARLQEVRLYTSSDLGQNWQLSAKASPSQTSFTFRAERDAEYWFAVRTLDTQGRLFPKDDAKVTPSMRVVVDTSLPSIQLAPMGRRGARVKVRWEVSDENLDLDTMAISYRAEGARDWRQVPITQAALIGAQEWETGTAAPLTVRATVEDRAGNQAETSIEIPDGVPEAPDSDPNDLANFGPPPPISPIQTANRPNTSAAFEDAAYGPSRSEYRSGNFNRVDPGFGGADGYGTGESRPSGRLGGITPTPNGPVPPGFGTPGSVVPDREPLWIASPQFSLQYAVDGAGAHGPSLVELWVTRDGGRTWTPMPEDLDHTSPYEVNLGGEGTYGIWLVVQSASGLGDRPPQPGDRPMQWVVVDETPPRVQLNPPQVGQGPALGKVLITWKANDLHLDQLPVLLSYRIDGGKTWIPMTDRLENTGRYIWTVPEGTPPRIHIRIDVVDKLGNRTGAETSANGPIVVDRTRPRGRILGLESGGPAQPDTTSRR